MAKAKTTTTGAKKSPAKSAKVPSAKAVAAAAAVAETKGQPAPAAVKAAVTPPAVAKPAAPAKPVAPVAPKPVMISKEERMRMIEQAAYFRAEKHGFQGDSSQHWSAAETEIDADLKRRGVTVV
ncbi:MAG TPA: DUF2934 domain-containing protein [Kiritimatiellia bacterium]|nr:DUF2934 domain-containing protein [Kiritimatiellia bacterium]